MVEEKGPEVQSIKTMMEILGVVEREGNSGVTEISNEINRSKSTVYKHLATLESFGYIEGTHSGYQLGLGFLDLGGSARSELELYNVSRPLIDQLSTQTGETVSLFIENGDSVICIYIASEHWPPIPEKLRIGKYFNIYSTQPGQAVLSHLPEKEVQTRIEELTFPIEINGEVHEKQEYLANLERYRDRGIIYNFATQEKEILSGAAPIGMDESVIGAIMITGPRDRVGGKQLEVDLGGSLQQTRNEIVRNLTQNR